MFVEFPACTTLTSIALAIPVVIALATLVPVKVSLLPLVSIGVVWSTPVKDKAPPKEPSTSPVYVTMIPLVPMAGAVKYQSSDPLSVFPVIYLEIILVKVCSELAAFISTAMPPDEYPIEPPKVTVVSLSDLHSLSVLISEVVEVAEPSPVKPVPTVKLEASPLLAVP